MPSEIVMVKGMPLRTNDEEELYFHKDGLNTLVTCRIEGQNYVDCIQLRENHDGYCVGTWVDEVWWDAKGKRCSTYCFVPDIPLDAERLASYHKHKHLHNELIAMKMAPGKMLAGVMY